MGSQDSQDDNDDDLDYVYESESDDEPYEYDSDDHLVEDEGSSDGVGVDGSCPRYRDWAEGLGKSLCSEPTPEALQKELISITERYEGNVPGSWEHIAGPSCQNTGGYSAHRITVEEMRGCTTFQCLIHKHMGWKPAPDDQEIELGGAYFLSGLSDYMPSLYMHNPAVTPVRQAVKRVNVGDAGLEVKMALGIAEAIDFILGGVLSLTLFAAI
jgi:hypothetical protein